MSTMTMARRIEATESSKCRSGRSAERVVALRPSGLGGESPRTFGDHERVAGEDAADVVLPAAVRAAFEMIEAELALHVFIRPLDAPTLFDSTHKLLATHALGERREHVMCGWRVLVGPFDHEPLLVVLDTIGAHHAHAFGGESRAELVTRGFSPGRLAIRARADPLGDRGDRHRVGHRAVGAHD